MDQLPSAIKPTSVMQTQPATTDPLAGLPLWCRILLGRVSQGLLLEDARNMAGSKVSLETIFARSVQSPAWGDMLRHAQAGTLDHCPVLSVELTRAHAWAEEERRHKLSMEASERYAHPYMRLGAEIRGDIQHGPTQAVQVNIGARTWDIAQQEQQEPSDAVEPTT